MGVCKIRGENIFIKFSKAQTKNLRLEIVLLEKNIKILELI